RSSILERVLRPRSFLLLAGAFVALSGGCNACNLGQDKDNKKSSTGPAPAPILKYVQQIVGGKYISPLAPPALTKTANYATALPDLPPLSAHGKAAPPPPKAKGEHPCGSAHVGDKLVPLDCMDPDYGKIEHAAHPLIGTDVLHGKEITLPTI